MRVYVTGASGKLGQAVMKLLPEAIPVSLRDESADLKKTFANADVVIHLAGSLKFNDKDELWHVNYDLAKKVAESTPTTVRLIHASSISVYGKKLVENPTTEKSPCNPDSEYAKSKYEGEKEILKHSNAVALRIAAIYGPQFEDYFKMMDVLKKNGMVLIGDGSNSVPFVHVDDVAQAVVSSMKSKPGTYLICADSITQKKIYEVACKALGVPTPTKSVPKSFAPFFLGIYNGLRKLMGKSSFLTNEHIDILSNNRVFDCSKAKKELKFKPRSTEQGIKELVVAYKNR